MTFPPEYNLKNVVTFILKTNWILKVWSLEDVLFRFLSKKRPVDEGLGLFRNYSGGHHCRFFCLETWCVERTKEGS